LLFSPLAAKRQEVVRNASTLNGNPPNIKRSATTKQRPPDPISNVYLDMEALVTLFEPFTNFSEAREQHGKLKPMTPS
jgi:hypothetical protein